MSGVDVAHHPSKSQHLAMSSSGVDINNSNKADGADGDDTKSEVSLSSSLGWAGNYSKKLCALTTDYTCGPLRVVQVGPHTMHWQRLHAPGHAVLPRADGTLQHFYEKHKHVSDADLMRQMLRCGIARARAGGSNDSSDQLDPSAENSASSAERKRINGSKLATANAYNVQQQLMNGRGGGGGGGNAMIGDKNKAREVDVDLLKQRLLAQSVPLPPARPLVNVYDPRSRQPPVYDDASSIFSMSTATTVASVVSTKCGSSSNNNKSAAAAILSSSRLHLPGIVSAGAAAGNAGNNINNSGRLSEVSPAKQQQQQQQQRPSSRQQERAASAALDAVRTETGSVKSELARARRTLDTIERVVEQHKRAASSSAAGAGATPIVEDNNNNNCSANGSKKTAKDHGQTSLSATELATAATVGGTRAKRVAESVAATPTVGTANLHNADGGHHMAARREIVNSLTISRRACTPFC